MARPAPCAMFGAVALQASPIKMILFEGEYQGKLVTPEILRMSLLRIWLESVL